MKNFKHFIAYLKEIDGAQLVKDNRAKIVLVDNIFKLSY